MGGSWCTRRFCVPFSFYVAKLCVHLKYCPVPTQQHCLLFDTDSYLYSVGSRLCKKSFLGFCNRRSWKATRWSSGARARAATGPSEYPTRSSALRPPLLHPVLLTLLARAATRPSFRPGCLPQLLPRFLLNHSPPVSRGKRGLVRVRPVAGWCRSRRGLSRPAGSWRLCRLPSPAGLRWSSRCPTRSTAASDITFAGENFSFFLFPSFFLLSFLSVLLVWTLHSRFKQLSLWLLHYFLNSFFWRIRR
jgi:hypothetical protein